LLFDLAFGALAPVSIPALFSFAQSLQKVRDIFRWSLYRSAEKHPVNTQKNPGTFGSRDFYKIVNFFRNYSML